MDNVLPGEANKILSGYHTLAKWSILTYIVGFITTASAFALGSITILFAGGQIVRDTTRSLIYGISNKPFQISMLTRFRWQLSV